MKKLCRNCGAKVPKKAEICPKCGEPYEYIDLVRLDPEEEKLIQVTKPSVMSNVCTLLLSIAAFCYALSLIYFQFTDPEKAEKVPAQTAATDETSEPEESSESEIETVHYNAVDFLGQSFADVKKVLGDRYSIKLSENASAEFTDFPITVATLNRTLEDDSPITQVIIRENGQINAVASADKTFDELKIVLGLTEAAPELNEKDAFYYAHTTFDNGLCKMSADFKFDNEATDIAPIEVILTDISLNIPKNMGTVSGIDLNDVLNVRAEASYDADFIDELTNGDQVEILEEITDAEDNHWYKIKFDDKEGFVAAEYVVNNSEIKNLDKTAASETEESESDGEDEDEDNEDDDEDYDEDEEDYE